MLFLGSAWVRDKAFKQVSHSYKENHHDKLINNSVPIYKKLEVSRKKIHVWRTVPRKLNTDAFSLALALAEDILQKEADFIIKPSITVEWRKYGKSVSLYAPVEIRSIDDVASLALILKQVLKHEINVDDAFNQSRYTRLDWLEEFKLKGDL